MQLAWLSEIRGQYEPGPDSLCFVTTHSCIMNKWLKRALAALLVVLLASGIWRALAQRDAQQQALASQAALRSHRMVELTSTDLVLVKRVELTQGIAISGSIKAVNSAIVKARVPGELQGLTVREGQSVVAGQIIARIEASEIQSRLKQAQQLSQAAKAQVDIAQRSFDNNQSLVKQGFISSTALDASLASLAAARANYQAAQAATEVAAKSMQDALLRAPISGLVSQRLAQNGEHVAPEARIIEIVDLSQLELEASVSADEAVAVRVGQSAQLKVEGSAQPVAARVVRSNPSTVAGSRAVIIYLALANSDNLRQGLFAQGTLATGQLQSLALPASAVRSDKPQPYVQLVKDGKVVHHSINADARGEFNGQAMVAVSGLSENTQAIAGSVGALLEGSSVKLSADASK